MADVFQPPPPMPAPSTSRPRASAFRLAQRAAWQRRRLLQVAALAGVAALVVGTSVTLVMAAGFGSLPNADALVARPLPSDTLVYDRSGTVLLADLHEPGMQHYQAPLSAMGQYLPAATVAIEDSNFYREPGVDPFSIARAAVTDLRAGSAVEGGSTITQQLVKRQVLGEDHSFTRKLREAALAMRISADFSKSQILGMYLNDIFYGNTAYGAQAAARIYFHRDASQLDLAQAAMLAGLPQDPSLLDPLRHWDAAKPRQKQVLDAMVHTNVVTEEEADQAYAEDLSAPAHLFGPQPTNVAQAFVSYVESELSARLGAGVVAGGGLRVVSSLDWNLQQIGQQAVADAVTANSWRRLTDGALVAMDPRTGQVLAMVGSAGPKVPGAQYNMAVGPPRNPGSSFKVFTYTAAIDSHRYTMVTPVVDAPLTVDIAGSPPYQPKNYDQRYHGTCQVQVCLGNSLNVPAVEVELGTGVENVVNEARNLGAPPLQQHGDRYTSDDPAQSFGPSLTLGGYGETPLQMATGVSALASGGMLHEPNGVLLVAGPDGRQLFRADNSGRRVLDAGTAYVVSQMLSDAANRQMVFGTNTPLTLSGHRAAAKTGTTDNYKDAWTVGYTPSLAAAVWMGNTDSHPMVTGSDGIFVAAPAWHQFMTGALGAMQRGNEWYQQPSDVATWDVDGRAAYFLQGTSPDQPAPPLPSFAHLAKSDNGDHGNSRHGGGSGGALGGTCRAWTYQGTFYWSCAPGNSGLPGDPLAG
ncbi:MAG TPA: transglycosylase domain-containing protein [Candidatus Dormibacteraeota bacterium]|nr:transglycosylase domain-containing protein [Candidatus Dormibacteraeota bacterium]